MMVSLRKFSEKDIINKVKWINNPENNRFLHYELPLDIEKTKTWYFNSLNRTDRYDAVIEADGIPVGIIGLLLINDGKAEYYITIGETEYKGKGIAKQASHLLLDYARDSLGLKMIYLFTETSNVSAQKLFERIGFKRIRTENNSALNRGALVDRFYYEYEL